MELGVWGVVRFKEVWERVGGKRVRRVDELGLMKGDEYIECEVKMSGEEEVWEVIGSRNIRGEEVILEKD